MVHIAIAIGFGNCANSNMPITVCGTRLAFFWLSRTLTTSSSFFFTFIPVTIFYHAGYHELVVSIPAMQMFTSSRYARRQYLDKTTSDPDRSVEVQCLFAAWLYSDVNTKSSNKEASDLTAGARSFCCSAWYWTKMLERVS
jgi:hypothetical protein